ncbi:MAG: hypothetical protein WA103_00370 [Minisyncoccales bacterium]
MKKNYFGKLLLSAVFSVGFFVLLPVSVLAIGQMTQPIVFENAMRGQELTETLTLFSSQDADVVYGLAGSGDIANWASFYKIDDIESVNPITEIDVPAKEQVKVTVKFFVPADTPNGKYTGSVAVTGGVPERQESSLNQVQVMDRVARKVTINVTDEEKILLEAEIIPAKYGVSVAEPLRIKALFENKGNVEIRPETHIKITRLSDSKTVHTAIYPYPEDEEAIKPFSSKVLDDLVVWQPLDMDLGKYNAQIKVKVNGDVKAEKDFNFDVMTNQDAAVLGMSTQNNVVGDGEIFGMNKSEQTVAIYTLLAIILFVVILVAMKVYGNTRKKLENKEVNQ